MAYTPTEWENGELLAANKFNKMEAGIRSANSSYVPTEWTPGDVITAEALNKIENGIANAAGGAQSVVTGTITFSEAQSTAPPLNSAVSITHNLGRTPIGVAWTIENTDAANIGGSTYSKTVVGPSLVGGELITDNNYIGFANMNSASATVNQMTWPYSATSAHNVFASLNCTDTTCLLFVASGPRIAGTIPADTTIRWFVW